MRIAGWVIVYLLAVLGCAVYLGSRFAKQRGSTAPDRAIEPMLRIGRGMMAAALMLAIYLIYLILF